jgi:putative ABC transport system permease protein
MQTVAERHGVEYDRHFCFANEEILHLEGYGNSRFAGMAYGAALVLALLIGVMSVVVISNAFRLSAGERIRHFGLLKSVGATKNHIFRIILNEGLMLSAIGIPAGILAGLGLEAAALAGANQMIEPFAQTAGSGFSFNFTATPITIVLTAVFALATVMASAYFPARQAAKIAAIDAIRLSGEVKVKEKQARVNPLVAKLFGFEGALAVKSLKRSGRAYRATVVSLTVSVVLFIACGEFAYSFMKTMDTAYPDVNMTAGVTYFSFDRIMPYEQIKRITEKFEEYESAVVRFQGRDTVDYKTALPEGMLTEDFIKYAYEGRVDGYSGNVAVEFVIVDDATHEEFRKQAGVAPGEPILLNKVRRYYSGDITREYVPFHFKPMTLNVRGSDGSEREVTLRGEARELPASLLSGFQSLLILLPRADMNPVYWYIDVPDSAGFTAYAAGVLAEEIPEGSAITDAYDVAGQIAAQMTMVKLVLIFIYGFVGLLTLIGLTNVISVISANTRLRSREFAVLQSAGMTRDGLKRMLNLESLLYAAKSLAYGLTIGAAAAVLLYKIFSQAVDYDFVFPWLNAAECVAGVFAVTWVTMRYASSRLRVGSIVDAIRE